VASPLIEQRIELSLTPTSVGSLSVRVELEIPDQVTGLEITVPTVSTGVATTGMTRTDAVTYQWDEQTSRPQISLTVPENAPSDDPHGGIYVADAGDWAVVEAASTGAASWQYRGGSPTFTRTVHVAGEGVVSPDGAVAYLGPHDEYRDTTGDQTTRLVVPTASNLSPQPSVVLAGLDNATDALDVGALSPEVVAIALPTTKTEWGALGRQAGDDGFWVQADASMTTPNNTWFHEYVHTRQSFGWTDETRWLVEATANYYAGLLSFNLGYTAGDEFRRHVATDRDSDAVLSAPNQWPSRHTPYSKGMRVLAALDHRIRTATDGTRSFIHVFRSMNKQDDLTHDNFVEIVNNVASGSNRRWLDRYVGSAACPELPHDFVAAIGERTAPTGTETGGRMSTVGDGEGGDLGDTDDTPSESDTEGEAGDTEAGDDSPACPVCDTVVPPTRRYCDGCGYEVGVVPDGCENESGDDGPSPGERCPVCNTAVDASTEYCPQCGTGLVPTCPVCDAQHGLNADYCANCGHRL
jgi:hypothetical protein